jgi:hypothetical protein
MGHDLFFHARLLLGLLCLCILLYGVWPRGRPTPAKPIKTRSKAPKPFQGLTHKPSCETCAHTAEPRPQAPSVLPPRMVSTRGRRRKVDTSSHFCPNPTCAYTGWVGWGNHRASGHSGSGPWRQFHCLVCQGHFQETHGTPLHGKRVPAELIVRVVASSAEGLGIRAVVRVFEIDPNTVPAWLVEAADHLQVFVRCFLHDVHVSQVQLDGLFAL